MFVALWLAAAVTTVCLEVDGSLSPVVCKAPGTRLDARTEVCECPSGRRTEAPVCAAGEIPPSDNRALNVFRRKAGADGSLVGDRFQDRPVCVPPASGVSRRP